MMQQPALGKTSKCVELEIQRLSHENQRLRERDNIENFLCCEWSENLSRKSSGSKSNGVNLTTRIHTDSVFTLFENDKKRLSKSEPRKQAKSYPEASD